MKRGTVILFVASMLLCSVGLVALFVWLVSVRQVPHRYVLGVSMVVLGVGVTVLHLSVSDDYLRKHFGGEENANRLRQSLRGGWVGVLLGIVTIAAEYFLGTGQ